MENCCIVFCTSFGFIFWFMEAIACEDAPIAFCTVCVDAAVVIWWPTPPSWALWAISLVVCRKREIGHL
jgi:hypothetical protein